MTSERCPTCKSDDRKKRLIERIPPRNVGSHAFFGWEGDCTDKWHTSPAAQGQETPLTVKQTAAKVGMKIGSVTPRYNWEGREIKGAPAPSAGPSAEQLLTICQEHNATLRAEIERISRSCEEFDKLQQRVTELEQALKDAMPFLERLYERERNRSANHQEVIREMGEMVSACRRALPTPPEQLKEK